MTEDEARRIKEYIAASDSLILWSRQLINIHNVMKDAYDELRHRYMRNPHSLPKSDSRDELQQKIEDYRVARRLIVGINLTDKSS